MLGPRECYYHMFQRHVMTLENSNILLQAWLVKIGNFFVRNATVYFENRNLI